MYIHTRRRLGLRDRMIFVVIFVVDPTSCGRTANHINSSTVFISLFLFFCVFLFSFINSALITLYAKSVVAVVVALVICMYVAIT